MNKYNKVMDKIEVSEDMRQRILGNIEKEVSGSDNKSVPGGDGKDKRGRIIRFINYYGARAAVFMLVAVGAYAVIRTVGINRTQETAAPESAVYESAEVSESAVEAEEAAEVVESEAAGEAVPEDAAPDLMEDEIAEDFAVENKAESEGLAAIAGNELNASEAQENSSFKQREAVGAANSTDQEALSPESSISGDDHIILGDRIKVESAEELSKNLGYPVKEVESLSKGSENAEYYYSPEGAEIVYESPYGEINIYVSDGGVFSGGRSVDPEDYGEMKDIDAGSRKVTALGRDGSYNVIFWTDDGITYIMTTENGITEEEIISILGM